MFRLLPVLETLISQMHHPVKSRFEKVAIVCVQHLLETNGSLFEALLCLGVHPNQIFVLGKIYSTSAEVAEKLRTLGLYVHSSKYPVHRGEFANCLKQDINDLWEIVAHEAARRQFKKIVVLDDGGRCIHGIPQSIRQHWPIVSIEQTTSGLRLPTGKLLPLEQHLNFPVIQLASSAAKRQIEPPMISEAVLTKLRKYIILNQHPAVYGVIGLGNVGNAVAKDLVKTGSQVFVYDIDSSLSESMPGTIWSNSVEEVFQNADYIFGCTGHDVLSGATWVDTLKGNKTLISCSSEDKEFLFLLKAFSKSEDGDHSDPLQTFSIQFSHCIIKVVRGGFPVNFDGTSESVPATDIQMTRGLQLSAILQAVLCARTGDSFVTEEMLAPLFQRVVVESWMAAEPSRRRWYSDDVLDGIKKLDWIRDKSRGCYYNCPELLSYLL